MGTGWPQGFGARYPEQFIPVNAVVLSGNYGQPGLPCQAKRRHIDSCNMNLLTMRGSVGSTSCHEPSARYESHCHKEDDNIQPPEISFPICRFVHS